MKVEFLEQFYSKLGLNLISLMQNLNKASKQIVKFNSDGTVCPVWACKSKRSKIQNVYKVVENTRKRKHYCLKCHTEYQSLEILPPKPSSKKKC